ncbi:MAG: alpha/beta fold hydrolase [Actinomycetota bacterium]|nr:alpha/beta fold hydrolase [Actinomycetota bacterium]
MARILCLHGLGGTAATMTPMVDALVAAGHDAFSLTLPGHDAEPEALHAVGWAEWLAAALVETVDVVVGQSMGGSLALAVAARGGCRGVVAINVPAPDPDALDGLEWQRSRGLEWVDGPPLADGEVGYTRLPVVALLQMVEGSLATDLAAVTVPVLLVTSALDEVVDPFSAELVASSLGGPVERVTLHGSGHVATLGPERDLLTAVIARFVAGLP